MNPDPGDWNARIDCFVEWIVVADSMGEAEDFLACHYARGGGPLRGLQVVLKLMRRCDAGQAARVSRLLDEFLSDQLPRPALRVAREQERRMRLRLGLSPRPRLGS